LDKFWGTFTVRVGFSGSSFDERRIIFSLDLCVSGEIATPIISGLMLLLENIFGLDISNRGGTFGANRGETFAATPLTVPPGPVRFLSVDPRNPWGVLGLLVKGTNWKGSISLSLAFRCFLLRQQANNMIPTSAAAPPPMEPTVIPIIWGFVKAAAGVGVSEAASADSVVEGGAVVIVGGTIFDVSVRSVDGEVLVGFVVLAVIDVPAL
jgi:hypothetical protein